MQHFVSCGIQNIIIHTFFRTHEKLQTVQLPTSKNSLIFALLKDFKCVM